MVMVMDPETAKRLRDQGYITDDTYSAMVPTRQLETLDRNGDQPSPELAANNSNAMGMAPDEGIVTDPLGIGEAAKSAVGTAIDAAKLPYNAATHFLKGQAKSNAQDDRQLLDSPYSHEQHGAPTKPTMPSEDGSKTTTETPSADTKSDEATKTEAKTYNQPLNAGSSGDSSSSALRTKQLGEREDQAADDTKSMQDAEAQKTNAYIQGQKDATDVINNNLKDEDEAIKRRDNLKQQSYDEVTKGYNDIQQQVKALGDKEIDPDRKWKSLSNGGKFAVGASFLLGGLSQGMLINAGAKGATNPGVDMWQKSIDRDIDAQRFNIQNKKGALEAETNILAKKYATSDDMVGYMKAKQVEGWERVGHQLDILQRQTNSEQAKADLQKAQVEVRQKYLDPAKQALQDHQYQSALKREQAAAAAASAASKRHEDMMKGVRDTTEKLMVEHGMSYDDAMRVAYRVHTGQDIGAKDKDGKSLSPTPLVPRKDDLGLRDQQKRDAENLEREKALQSGYNDAEKYYKYFDSDPKGDITSKVGLGSIPGTDAKTYQLKVQDWNAQATLALGPIVEAMNKGKPGAVELRTLQSEVHITPQMSKQDKLARVRRLQELQRNAAAITGNKVGPQSQSSGGAGVNDVKFK